MRHRRGYSIKRAAEFAREWGCPLFGVQIDLKKAFDKISDEAVTKALKQKGVPRQLIAVLCKMWSQSMVTAKLGHASSRKISLHRGVPHGGTREPAHLHVRDGRNLVRAAGLLGFTWARVVHG